MTAKRMPKAARDKVKERSDGICEGCGSRPATDIHHRKYLSRGGTHDVWNLLALCGGDGGMAGGNHSGCHGEAHKDPERTDDGWSAWSWEDVEFKHVLYRGRRVMLTKYGTTEDLEVPF